MLFILERIILGLRQEGWLIERESENWILARKGEEGLLFASLAPGQPLVPSCEPFFEDLSIKHWEAIIFCPEGLSSYDIKQPALKNVQTWYIDLQTGSVFPYPPNPKQQTLNWLLSYMKHPTTTSEPFSSTFTDREPIPQPNANALQRLRKLPYITYILIAINLILFLMMTLAGGSTQRDVLILFGAKVNKLILQGEVWRLITAMFLHIGFLHLAFNLYALWALGPFTEELLGRLRYLLFYFFSGISGSIASFIFTDALSAGASGAIFGILGALVTYTRRNPLLWKSGFGKNLVIIILINLGLGFFQPGIDIYAHIGGLICGLLLGRLFP
jgi:rhomboid protease GluP